MAQESGSDKAWVVVADVTQPESVVALFATIQSQWGRLDVLFNNAGGQSAQGVV